MPQGYPISIDISNRLIVIVGGGSVALRKASSLVEAGARRVRIVAPEINPCMPAGAECIRETYVPTHLDGASMVFAATNSHQVNAVVTRDARARGILVNQADDPAASDFATPAQLRRGPVTITVSAGSAALSIAIRDSLALRFDDRWQQMAQAMQELRPMLQSDAQLNEESRQALFRALATDEAFEVLAKKGMAGLKNWFAQHKKD